MRPNAIRCQVCSEITNEAELSEPFVEGVKAPACSTCGSDWTDYVAVTQCGMGDDCTDEDHDRSQSRHVETVTW